MTQNEFNRFLLGSKVRVEWDHSITGIITGLTDDQYITIDTGTAFYSFPLNQLEFVD